MSAFKPNQVNWQSKEKTEKDGVKQKEVSFSMDTEDIIAIVAGVVALIFAICMVIGWLPINKLTIGVLGFSGVGIVIAQIIKARAKGQERKEK